MGLFDSRSRTNGGDRTGSSADAESFIFGFAFNDSNYSDRILRIEIVGHGGAGGASFDNSGKSDCDGYCTSIADCAQHHNRRREDMKKDQGGDTAVCDEEQVLNQPEVDDVLGCENDDEETVAVIEEAPSAHNNDSSWSMDRSSVINVETLHISSPILAVKSRFFSNLFSIGMRESKQRQVTLRVDASEEGALMELLFFMYTDSLKANTAADLLAVLRAADKFEVASCMRYCSKLLRQMPMSRESALLYLNLPSCVRMAEAVQPLTDAAKHFLADRYKDISKYQEEVMALPIAGIEAILCSDDLQVASEDAIYDFVLKWSRSQYPKLDERREILGSRLAHLIRFPYMTCEKLGKVLTCPDFDHPVASGLVHEGIFFKADAYYGLGFLASEDSSPSSSNRRFIERAYKYRPIKVLNFELTRPACVVYLELTKEQCANLFPSGRVYSQSFFLGSEGLFLCAQCNMDEQSSFRCFGFFLGMQKGSVRFTVDYEFAARMKPSEEFQRRYKGNYTLTGGNGVGHTNLFAIPWTNFMADDSPYFINGILHLRAQLTIRH